MSILSVKNLSYRVGEKEILHDISFDVEEGSMTCIVGPNGCGKSTLLSHISRKLPSKMNNHAQLRIDPPGQRLKAAQLPG